MQHKIELSVQEKRKAWLNLCDFSFKLIEDNLGKEDLQRKLRKMREAHVKVNHSILEGLSRIKR